MKYNISVSSSTSFLVRYLHSFSRKSTDCLCVSPIMYFRHYNYESVSSFCKTPDNKSVFHIDIQHHNLRNPINFPTVFPFSVSPDNYHRFGSNNPRAFISNKRKGGCDIGYEIIS